MVFSVVTALNYVCGGRLIHVEDSWFDQPWAGRSASRS